MSTTLDSPRLSFLDLLRFLSAFSVMLFHYTFCGFERFTNFRHEEIGNIFKYGYLGVNSFFILSGFLIALSAQNKTAWEFVTARISRLFPAYWAACIIIYVAVSLWGNVALQVSEKTFFLNLTMIPTLFKAKFMSSVFWTLLEEIRFYFMATMVLFFFGYKRFENFIFIWTLICVANYFFRNHYIEYFFRTFWGPYFILGALYYMAYKSGWNWQRALAAGCMLFLALAYSYSRINGIAENYNTVFNPLIDGAIIAGINIIFILFSLGYFKMNTPKTYLLGCLTYAFYLVHEPLGYIIFNNFDIKNPTLELLLAIGVSVTVSLLIYYIAEKPGGRFLKKILNKKKSENISG